jgi:hypothetical protein
METPKPPHPHESAYYAIGSLAISATMILTAVPALLLASWLQVSDYKGMPPSDIRTAMYGGYIGAAFAILLCLTSVVTAARGLRPAERTGEPKVLCDSGIFLGLFATAVWIGCAVAWHSQAWRFVKPE